MDKTAEDQVCHICSIMSSEYILNIKNHSLFYFDNFTIFLLIQLFVIHCDKMFSSLKNIFAGNLNKQCILFFERRNYTHSSYMCTCLCFSFIVIHVPLKDRINLGIEITFWKLHICNICDIYI